MVLPKTWSSFLLNMLQGLLFTLNTINITVGIINCGMQLGSVKNGYFLPNGAFYWNYQAMYFQPIVQLTELFIPLVMVLTEWFCNIRLIMTSLRVAKEDVTSFKESLRSASSSSSIAQDQQNNSNNSNNKYVGNNSNQNRAIGSRSRELDNIPSNQTKSNPPSTSTPAKISDSSILMVLNTSLKKRPITQQESQLSLSPPNALLQLKEKEYRWLRVKMILLFTTLTLLDFIVLVIDILMELSFPGNNSAEESNVMASCFVGIHFSISFYLLGKTMPNYFFLRVKTKY